MSRYTISSYRYTIAYGYDDMLPEGGYFFQVYDRSGEMELDEGLIVNEGYTTGISWFDMLALMTNVHVYSILPTHQFLDHLLLIKENKPI